MGALSAWAMAAGLQTYRDIAKLHRMPYPSEFLAAGAVFGVLALLDSPTRGLTGWIAWGFLAALVLQAGGPQEFIAGGSSLPVAKAAFPAGSTTAAPAAPARPQPLAA